MKYTKQYALLKVKTDTIEYLLYKAETHRETIDRYMQQEDNDEWYKQEANNLEQEINAINQLIDTIAK